MPTIFSSTPHALWDLFRNHFFPITSIHFFFCLLLVLLVSYSLFSFIFAWISRNYFFFQHHIQTISIYSRDESGNPPREEGQLLCKPTKVCIIILFLITLFFCSQGTLIYCKKLLNRAKIFKGAIYPSPNRMPLIYYLSFSQLCLRCELIFLFLPSYSIPNNPDLYAIAGITTVLKNITFTFNDTFLSYNISIVTFRHFIQPHIILLATSTTILQFSYATDFKYSNLVINKSSLSLWSLSFLLTFWTLKTPS